MKKQQYPHHTLPILFLAGFLLTPPPTYALELSGRDGQELQLKKLDMKVVVEGPLSLTEMTMHFHNPQDRMIEGRFKLTLPTNATVSRFAKDVGNHLMEGEVVERQKAKRVYTKILHTPRDPALLENAHGNLFTTRVYPINPRKTFRIVLSYSALTKMNRDGKRLLTIPLRNLPKIGKFKLSVFVKPVHGEKLQFKKRSWFKDIIQIKKSTDSNKLLMTLRQENLVPAEDLVLRFDAANKDEKGSRAVIYQYKDIQMVCYRPCLQETIPKDTKEDWKWYVDTSTSMNLGCANPAKYLKAVMTALEEKTPCHSYFYSRIRRRTLHAFGANTQLLHEWNKVNWQAALSQAISKLSKHNFFGGTDLREMWQSIRDDAATREKTTNYVVVTDGCATFGELNQKELAANKLSRDHRVHVLVIGGQEDTLTTSALAKWGRGHLIRLPITRDWKNDSACVAQELLRPLGRSFRLRCKEAQWITPDEFYDVAPGNEMVAFLKANDGERISLNITKDTKIVNLTTTGPLLEREAYRSRLRQLEKNLRSTLDPQKQILSKKMVEISQDHRVLCPLTALLVLETEYDYKRFGISRLALRDILAIEKGQIIRKQPSFDAPLSIGPKASLSVEQFIEESEQPRQSGSGTTCHYMSTAITDNIFQSRRVTYERKPRKVERRVELISGVRKTVGAVYLEELPPEKLPKPKWTKGITKNRSLKKLLSLHKELIKAPRCRKLWQEYCEMILAARYYDDLKREVLKWLQSDPQNPLVYSHLSAACHGLGNSIESVRAAMSLVEISPSNASYWNLAGFLLLRARANERAEQAFRKAIKLRPDRHNNYRGLAYALWAQQNYREAVETLRKAKGRSYELRYGYLKEVFDIELGYILRSWLNNEATAFDEIEEIARSESISLDDKTALLVIMHWETDACNVDLKVSPPEGGALKIHNRCWSGLGPEYAKVPFTSLEEGDYHIGLQYSSRIMGLVRPVCVVVKPTLSADPAIEVHTTTLCPGNYKTKLLTTLKIGNFSDR